MALIRSVRMFGAARRSTRRSLAQRGLRTDTRLHASPVIPSLFDAHLTLFQPFLRYIQCYHPSLTLRWRLDRLGTVARFANPVWTLDLLNSDLLPTHRKSGSAATAINRCALLLHISFALALTILMAQEVQSTVLWSNLDARGSILDHSQEEVTYRVRSIVPILGHDERERCSSCGPRAEQSLLYRSSKTTTLGEGISTPTSFPPRWRAV